MSLFDLKRPCFDGLIPRILYRTLFSQKIKNHPECKSEMGIESPAFKSGRLSMTYH